MKLSALLAPLLDAKADHELIRAQLLAFEAEQEDALEKRRESDRARQAKRRHVTSRDVTVTERDTPPSPILPQGSSPTPPSPNPTNPIPPYSPPARAVADEFETAFWPRYPNKVGKADARQKFVIARRSVDLGTILDGLDRYRSKTDDRPWCNPATWLHQERWTDQPAAPQARGSPPFTVVKDTGANAARRRLEALQNERRSGTTDDHQPALGLLPGYSVGAR